MDEPPAYRQVGLPSTRSCSLKTKTQKEENLLSKEEKRLEKKILLLIKTGQATTVLEIVGKLWKKPYCNDQIRRAVWRMVDRGELALSEERKMVIRES